jgi:histidinol dehydrogenase
MSILPIIENPEKHSWKSLLARPVIEPDGLEETVRAILEDVKKNGDQAVDTYSLRFDKIKIDDRRVSRKELQNAESLLTDELKSAIRQAKKNIEFYHSRQLTPESVVETVPGIRCWRTSSAIEKVGLYIPGGTAPLFSTLLMLGVPARLAGCEEIIMCSPPQKDGTLHPAVLFTADLLGIDKIFKVGGVQAVAAMAYGTQTIPAVYKIFGPGNQYVTQAKKSIQLDGIAIDMPAGPSELAVYADESAVPSFVAADLLSQCEHGADSQVILVTSNQDFAKKVNESLMAQLEKLPRKSVALQSLGNSKIIVMDDRSVSMAFLNEYAPEHLMLVCREAEVLARDIRNAGSVFIGNYAPESAGDYASGTNHTLPTNGFARVYGGVSMDSFVKKISFQQISREGLEAIANTVVEMASAEGLEAHAAAVRIRLGM